MTEAVAGVSSMAKIYYTDVEAAAKLNISMNELSNYVRDGKLRSFQDGPKKMFKVEDVDKLAGASGEVELAPAEGGISLAEADKPRPMGKEDTVITAEGISIFDDEDLEIEAADPMAKTQIAPTLDEQVSIEGVGSGSGLLDLTRESDDTSLGEVLEHIDEPTSQAVGSSLGSDEAATSAVGVSEGPSVAPVFVEVADPASGAFNGTIVALSVVMLLSSMVAIAVLMSSTSMAGSLHEDLIPALVVGLLVVIVGAIIGYLMGKSAAARRALAHR
jgi:ABC-type cobalt transport system substrate-binding protein